MTLLARSGCKTPQECLKDTRMDCGYVLSRNAFSIKNSIQEVQSKNLISYYCSVLNHPSISSLPLYHHSHPTFGDSSNTKLSAMIPASSLSDRVIGLQVLRRNLLIGETGAAADRVMTAIVAPHSLISVVGPANAADPSHVADRALSE